MSSRAHRRRDRSWERDDRDRVRDRDRERYHTSRGGSRFHEEKRRPSRSRSPRREDRDRDRDRDRERDSNRDKRDRRDRDYDHRRDDDRDRRDDRRQGRERDDRRETSRREDKAASGREEKPSPDGDVKERAGSRAESSTLPEPPKGISTSSARPSVDQKTPEHIHEDGEAMDDTNGDDAAMMAAMGLGGFGTTKGKHVEGNQEGATDVKKIRTWRQYMNRRGGFNRPLDKIK